MFPRINKGTLEYFLRIQRAWSRERNAACIRFTFQTVEEFHFFRYGIAIDVERRDPELRFTLRGLTAGDMTMPGNGFAEKVVDMFDLLGEYRIQVFKQGEILNDCSIKVTPKSIRLLRNVRQEDPFISVSIPN